MLPYFDVLIEKIKKDDPVAREAFGEYVHFGYWENKPKDSITAKDFKNAEQAMLEEVIKCSGIKDGSCVLDVGCGFGGTIKWLNENYHNCKIFGLNIDERQIEIAENLIVPKNGNFIKFIKADACNIPIENNYFDVVLCVESIFHFKNRNSFFKECSRLLKKSGILVLSDFVPLGVFSWLLNFIENNFHIIGQAYGNLDINISTSRYKNIASENSFLVDIQRDITKKTMPTYLFLKDNFYRISKKREFNIATNVLNFFSRINIVKYMIISFKKM